MYQLLLTRRYLFSKIMPLLAAVAVLLCTAMVLTVWSVMGGFLTMLIGSGRTVTGDVMIAWPNAGFPYYQDLVQRLEKDPAVEAAAPMIESFGLIALEDGRKETAIIRGIEGESYARVTQFKDILWWKPLAKPLPKDKHQLDPRLTKIGGTTWEQIYNNGLSLSRADGPTGAPQPAIVMGIEVSGFNSRQPQGFYMPTQRERTLPDGRTQWVDQFMPRDGKVMVNMAPLDSSGKAVEMVSRQFPVANEFQSGVFEFDQKFVLMPLGACQEMLKMHAAKRRVKVAAEGPKVVATPPGDESFDEPETKLVDDPARVTHVLVKGKGDLGRSGAAEELRRRCEAIYSKFARDHKGAVPSDLSIRIYTWEDQNRTMINAVQKETALLLVLFLIISFVAVFLILAIFWSMVAEKTKDIGVLRAVGASSGGVAAWWVAYGFAIGIVGATLGLGLAWLIVTNINPIHEWLGEKLNIVIWDPRIYYFVKIPNVVESEKAMYVFFAALIASVLGALVPAVRAAWMDPVKALRFE
ncbi:MAG: ABC transporter permease [Planctomycetes bacterium]|nr:ABC transporter permease [Planctomycetota bacterium]